MANDPKNYASVDERGLANPVNSSSFNNSYNASISTTNNTKAQHPDYQEYGAGGSTPIVNGGSQTVLAPPNNPAILGNTN